jgi:hypothetical protein
MKKTLALLIAVLMVVAMLPLSVLTAAGEAGDAFAVYDAAGAEVGTYATLAEADAALADGYTLKLLADYATDAPYAWGAARVDDGVAISYTIDGNDFTVMYGGADSIWSFGANCAGDQITVKNIAMISSAADTIVVSDAAVVTIESGNFTSAGRSVVRTMAGASAGNPATLIIRNGYFVLSANAAAQANDAVVTNGTAGNVYVYGGIFMNANESVSEYVLLHTAAANNFKIYGGVMMATGAQKGFYKPANTAATAGVSLPNVELPIVKGMTASYNMDGREVYYTSYGAAEGDALLVPMLSPAASIVVTEEGNTLAFTSKVGADLAAAIVTWARAKAVEAGAAANEYELDFGTLITVEDIFVEYGGSFDAVDDTMYCFNVYADLAGTELKDVRDIVAVTPEYIDSDMKEMRLVAAPFIELTIAGTTERFYGEFNMTTGMASMATVAASALRDNAAEADDTYQYPSITAAQAFNRYTEAEQQELLEYLAHEHEYNFRGECVAEDCDSVVLATLLEGITANFYTENGSAAFFELELEEGVSYAFGLTTDAATFEIYDENGVLCKLNGGIFTPAAAGTYYLRANGDKTGTCGVLFSHIHNVDYVGECTVCGENVAVDAVVGTDKDFIVVKGNSYVVRIALDAGVTYVMRTVNGNFTLYNAEGEEMTVEKNIFVCPEEGTGTYYMLVQATYTGKATAKVAHVHTYDHTGLCEHCGQYLGVQINNVYAYTTAVRVKTGDLLFYNIRLEQGKTYKIVSNGYVGSYTFYNADGEEQTLVGGNTFTCEVAGTYYLKISVQTDTAAQVRFEVEHGADCTYNYKGECTFTHSNLQGEQENVTCGKVVRSRFEDEATKLATVNAGAKAYFFVDYLSANVNYKITITGNVLYTFYNASGAAVTMDGVTENGVTTINYTPSANTVLYLVLENAGDATVPVSIAVEHAHTIDHRGQCTVQNTTTGMTASACKVREVTTIYADNIVDVDFTAGTLYRFAVTLTGDVQYKIAFENADVTWELKDAAGATLFTSADTAEYYVPTTMATYYMLVTANADSAEGATLSFKSHTHVFNNKGECADENCSATLPNRKTLTAGVEYDGFMGAGTHYFQVAMEAGNTYTLTFTANGVTYKLYGGENADVEQTLTEGAFVCETSATYYYVVTVAEDIIATEVYQVEVSATA